MRYFGWDGTTKHPLEFDSVVAVDEQGNEFELYVRRSDKTVALSCERGQLVIEPRASNTVNISVKRDS